MTKLLLQTCLTVEGQVGWFATFERVDDGAGAAAEGSNQLQRYVVMQGKTGFLGLTKLNYNACTLGDSQPVTIGFSDAAGEIAVNNPTIPARRQETDDRFRDYI